MITEAQRELRRNGLFASDIARIMTGHGVEVALQKLQRIPDPDLSDNIEVAIGWKAEPLILTAYEKHIGAQVQRNLDTLYHPKLSWMGCHRDAVRPGVNVEAKTVGTYNRDQWGNGGDEMPDYVLWQTQVQMACSGDMVTDVPVCFVTNKALKRLFLDQPPPIDLFQVRKDFVLEDALVAKATMVWECIQQGVTPPPENLNDIKLLYPQGVDKEVQATEEVEAWCGELLLVKQMTKDTKKREDDLKFKIQAFMKDASVLKRGHAVLATWKNDKDGQKLDADAFAAEQPEMYVQYLKFKRGARKLLPKAVK